MSGRIPVVSYLDLDDGVDIVAGECDSCGALHLDRRSRCGRCGGTSLTIRRLARGGRIRTFTVVHRSAPGVPVPFTSVVVDLDGGGTVRGTLDGPSPDPATITAGRRVRLVERSVGLDVDGTEAIGFAFIMEWS
jgi:uncharacterized OB-fold protein